MAQHRVFVGIDWGPEQHHAWVTNADGTDIADRRVAHSGAAIAEFADWIIGLAHGEVSAVAIGCETPHSAIVDVFLERGCDVFTLNPKQLDRFRDRFGVAGAKDDPRDAEVLSSSLRTDRRAFRLLVLDDPLTIQLREFSRQDTELGEDLGRLANRLRDHLVRTWPELLRLVPAADEPWLWALLKRAPTPDDGGRLGLAAVRRLLREHRIRRITPEQLHVVLRTPSVPLVRGVREGVRVRILDLVDQLPVVERQRRAAGRRLAETLAQIESANAEQGREQSDVTILQSLPGIGPRIAAGLLAEAAHALRDRDYHAVRQLGGVAPVTKSSGRTRVVMMRYACNHRLKATLDHWARGCIRLDPKSRAHYQQLRRRGHTHARAARGLIDRMLAVMIAMLRNRQRYDATRRDVSRVEATA
jgi:transposase